MEAHMLGSRWFFPLGSLQPSLDSHTWTKTPIEALALERLLNHSINDGKIADQVLRNGVAISQVGDASPVIRKDKSSL
jgi:hypothetical protein